MADRPTVSIRFSAAEIASRVDEMAAELVRVAAARKLREAPKLSVLEGLYDEFCARFPYEETDDQDAAIDAVTADLVSRARRHAWPRLRGTRCQPHAADRAPRCGQR